MSGLRTIRGLASTFRENISLRLTDWRRHALARNLVVLLLLLLMAALLAALLFWPYQGYEDRAVVVIEQGLGRRAIARRLTDQKVLRWSWPFVLYTYLRPRDTLKAGEYAFDHPMSVVTVFRKLERGEVHLYALTIPEGWTRWAIADAVAELELADREAFLRATENTAAIQDLAPEATTLEGYLFPDTYNFARPSDPKKMVETMVERFRRVFGELSSQKSNGNESRESLPGLSPHQTVTLASLVEKETGIEDERGVIASVFANRLRRGLPLACDPTVIYAARLANDGEFDGIIHQSDLDRESPYNTYRRAGLPPGPIASPGRAALEAALNPPQTDFLYFVSNTEGGHFFARTFAEHDRNVARYRRLRAQKQREAERQNEKRR